jgi:hypothetical protein
MSSASHSTATTNKREQRRTRQQRAHPQSHPRFGDDVMFVLSRIISLQTLMNGKSAVKM